MLGVVDMPTYLVGLVVVILLPGPNSLYVLSVAARRGVAPAYGAAAGVWTGDAVLMALAAGGVASLLQGSAVLFDMVKFLGAGYLGWLGLGLVRGGWELWRRSRSRELGGQDGLVDELVQQHAPDRGLTVGRAYRRALGVSLLNPKAILFFVAFFVQFVDPAYARPWLSFLLLGGLSQLASVVYLSLLIFAGVRLATAFRRRRALSAAVTSVAGGAFLAFAVKLATTPA